MDEPFQPTLARQHLPHGKTQHSPPTFIDGIGHGDPDADAVDGLGAVGLGQVLAVGQLQPHQDHGVGPGEDVLGLAQDVLQDLTLVPAQIPGFGGRGGLVAVGEGIVAQGGDGKLRALVRQVAGGADHGKGGWKTHARGQLGDWLGL